MREDLFNALSIVRSVAPAAVTAAVNGTGVDLAGFRGAVVVVDLGVFGGTTPTATIVIQESPDNAAWTAVPAADLQGDVIPAITPATANQVYRRGYLGTRRWIRVAVTAVGGGTPSLPMSAIVARGAARRAPVA